MMGNPIIGLQVCASLVAVIGIASLKKRLPTDGVETPVPIKVFEFNSECIEEVTVGERRTVRPIFEKIDTELKGTIDASTIKTYLAQQSEDASITLEKITESLREVTPKKSDGTVSLDQFIKFLKQHKTKPFSGPFGKVLSDALIFLDAYKKCVKP